MTDEEASGEEETDESDFGSEFQEEELGDEDPAMEEEEEEEEESAKRSIDSGEEEESAPPASLKKAAFHFQAIDDFEKFTEGMDDIEDEEEESSMDEGSSDDAISEEGSGAEDEAVGAGESKDDGTLLTFSEDKVAEEVEKGRAVKNQIG